MSVVSLTFYFYVHTGDKMMSTDHNTFQGISSKDAVNLAALLIFERVSFRYEGPTECADGIKRFSIEVHCDTGRDTLKTIRTMGIPAIVQ